MKKNVEWHMRNLDNSIAYCRRERDRLERHLACLAEWEESNKFREYQLDCARKEDITEFDAEKYKVKRGKNV